MTAASTTAPHRNCDVREELSAERLSCSARPELPGKNWADAPGQGRRGMGPSTSTRDADATSGRAIVQQGLTATCEDQLINGESGDEWRAVVWRMSPYERRRRGKAFPGDPRGHLVDGNTVEEQRGSGHSVVASLRRREDMTGEPGSNFPDDRVVVLGEETKATANHAGLGRMRVSASASSATGRPLLTNHVRAEARTGFGKSDRPGSQRGLWNHHPWRNWDPTSRNRKGEAGNPLPTGRCATLLSRHLHARFERRRVETGC